MVEDKPYGIHYHNERAVIHFSILDEMYHVYRIDENGMWHFYGAEDTIASDKKFKTLEEAKPYFLLASI